MLTLATFFVSLFGLGFAIVGVGVVIFIARLHPDTVNFPDESADR